MGLSYCAICWWYTNNSPNESSAVTHSERPYEKLCRFHEGLKVNYSKSFLVPINLDNDKVQHLANIMGCQVGTLPFTYLGLPLGTTRYSVEEFSSLLTRIEKRMMGLNKLLSYQGRMTFVNSILSALSNILHVCS
jgi:hypothetical protein